MLNRLSFSCLILTAAAGSAQAQMLPGRPEPLNTLGRHLGIGWSAGYHSCEHLEPRVDIAKVRSRLDTIQPAPSVLYNQASIVGSPHCHRRSQAQVYPQKGFAEFLPPYSGVADDHFAAPGQAAESASPSISPQIPMAPHTIESQPFADEHLGPPPVKSDTLHTVPPLPRTYDAAPNVQSKEPLLEPIERSAEPVVPEAVQQPRLDDPFDAALPPARQSPSQADQSPSDTPLPNPRTAPMPSPPNKPADPPVPSTPSSQTPIRTEGKLPPASGSPADDLLDLSQRGYQPPPAPPAWRVVPAPRSANLPINRYR